MAAVEDCPCCRFTVPENLFLPQDQSSEHAEDEPQPMDLISPALALQRLIDCKAPIIDTHSHAHLERPETADSTGETLDTTIFPTLQGISRLKILSCAVSPDDWNHCLDYASESTNRRIALGVHPWYIDRIILEATNELDDHWLKDLESLLQLHPKCIVGEIGLCRHAKFVRQFSGGKAKALELQRFVLTQQLVLAARYKRPVSVHCVDQHAVLLQILKDVAHDDILPPAIALHSFTGTAHHVQQLLQWEQTIRRDLSEGPLLYFGFSYSINFLGSTSERARRQNEQAICCIPRDRLLAESDAHSHRHAAAGTAGAVAYLAWVLQRNVAEQGATLTLERVALLTAQNATRFFSSISPAG